jgi:L-amino acid N-acyltransferase YncA
MDISVRSVSEADAPSIVGLMNPIIEAGSFTIMDQPLSVGEQEDFIRALPERGAFNVAVACKDDSIVGIQDILPIFPRISAFRHVCEIATFVSLTARRQGVGVALFRATLESARHLGFAKIVATIRADNPVALAFYEAQGFQMVGRARNHALVRGQFVDELLTELLIS